MDFGRSVIDGMNVFVSTQRIDSPNARSLLRRIAAAGLAVDHSPRNPLDGDDPRWRNWYKTGLPAAIAAADCFLIVIDGGWDSSTWMGEEAHVAEMSALPMYFWNPDRLHVKGMLRYLKRQLPDNSADAVRQLLARVETEQSSEREPPMTRDLQS